MPDSAPRGRLKIFLGYAAGVGKTYQMLEEAQQLQRAGTDVAIGYFEPHGRKDTIGRTVGLEVVPRRKIEYRGSWFEEMDTDAILARHPTVCVVDEFPHTNVPGAGRVKRWEDVLALLDAGIDVLTTMNVQHIESLNDQIYQITGIRVRETIPDWVVREANEVVMVDLTPRALLNRLERGVVYAPEKATQALLNFFKEPTLAVLRELALRQTAHEVDVRQTPEDGASSKPGEASAMGSQDRILIHVTDDPSSAALIRRGRRVADYLHADCFAVCVLKEGELRALPAKERESIERHLTFARNLHIETRVLKGEDAAATLVDFARVHQITQIFLARPRRVPRLKLGRTVVQKIVQLAEDMQVTVVAERRPAAG
jgi:two-component system, OmpR family, sensor histidine kinase KdpD